VLVQARRHPRPSEPLRDHREPDRNLHRALQRVVRPLPQPDAVYAEGSDTAAIPGVHGCPAGGAEFIREHSVSTIEQQPAVYTTPKTLRKGNILAYWLSSTDHK